MAGENIFIVEDEKIVAEDLKRMLERMGYKIVGMASSGSEALKQVETTKPDLVLMDIRIQGPLDGIDVAEHIFTQLDIPVIYLTAYADDTTVERAKGTLASGYILKPFEERGLKTSLEMALYRHNMERVLKNVEGWHGEILGNLGVAVMATDLKNHVAYMNKSAETLTGCLLDKIFGKSMDDLFAPEDGKSGLDSSRLILKKNGQRIPLECQRSPINDREGNALGTSFLFKELP